MTTIQNEPGGVRELAERRRRADRRDLFAAHALGALIQVRFRAGATTDDLETLAWEFADAMLEADPEANP